MRFLYCPVCGPVVHELVHADSPDIAVLHMVWHFLNAHPETSALELLDRLDASERPLMLNGDRR